MQDFTYFCPTKLVFGRGSIARLAELTAPYQNVLMLYGGGSIKHNGVYQQVVQALGSRRVGEFGGIEPNPEYETCMKAAAYARQAGADFLLAVGGGSVLDAVKFIAVAAVYGEGDPWDVIKYRGEVMPKQAVRLGAVMTLPATGSEMNPLAVISRESLKEKRAFSSDLVRPVFSILDPETTYSLPARQVANGIVDTFIHVIEQYLTYPADAPLQDRYAESVLVTLIEQAPKIKEEPENYNVRATLMWCATQALNQLLGCGVPQDWSTHMIGHELTALYGIDHAQSLAVVLPGVMFHQRNNKREKLLQYAARVWGLNSGSAEERIDRAIDLTEDFFLEAGVKTRLADYGIPQEAAQLVAKRLEERGAQLGERKLIGPEEAAEILALRL